MDIAKLRQIKKSCFGYTDISKTLGITPESAKVALSRLTTKSVTIKIKRNCYLLKDKWDALQTEDKFTLANLLQVPSYVSLMTALAYHEMTTQIQQNFIESIAIYRTKKIEIENTVFNYTKIKKTSYGGFIKIRGFFIALPEKALLDAFYLISIGKYKFDVTSIDPGKLNTARLKKMLKLYPKNLEQTLKKYGYFKKA